MNKLISLLFISVLTCANDCKLIKKGPHFSYSPNFNEVSSFWNQEYTGIDLVKNKIGEVKLRKDLLSIWDTFHQDHAYHVGSIIQGQNPSAYLKTHNSVKKIKYNDIFDFMSIKRTPEEFCKKFHCSHYVNLSMSLIPQYGRAKKNLQNLESLMSEMIKIKDTVFIISGGNQENEVVQIKQRLEKMGAILVSSINPDGSINNSYSSGESLVISAPADFSIVAYKNSQPYVFGATSAATPQVSATLALFSHITGYKLLPVEAKKLLTMTAQPYVDLPKNNSLGAGILNSYKIFKIAKNIANKCKPNLSCIKNYIKNFQEKDWSVLPSQKFDIKNTTCSEKQKMFLKAKSHHLLNPNKNTSFFLSEIYKKEGFEKNSKYYEKFSTRLNKNDNEVINSLFKSKKYYHLARYVYSHSEFFKNYKEIRELGKNQKSRDAIIQYVLSKHVSSNNIQIVKDFLKNPSNDMFIDFYILSNIEWNSYYKNLFKEIGLKNIEISSHNIRQYL